jgi:hypothetical protein
LIHDPGVSVSVLPCAGVPEIVGGDTPAGGKGGEVSASTLPPPSTATQNDEEGHDTAVRSPLSISAGAPHEPSLKAIAVVPSPTAVQNDEDAQDTEVGKRKPGFVTIGSLHERPLNVSS